MSIDRCRPWLRVADGDLRSARKLLEGPEPEVETACYHVQQAAEKYVKLLLVGEGRDVPRLHDIFGLLRLLGKAHPMHDALAPLAELTPLGFVFRYPSLEEQELPAVPEVEGWIDDVEKARTVILKHLGIIT